MITIDDKKRKKISISVDGLPSDIYKILDEKRNNRKLTQYIVTLIEFYQFNTNKDGIVTQLNRIETKIESLSRDTKKKESHSNSEIEIRLEDEKLYSVKKIIGGIDDEDFREGNF